MKSKLIKIIKYLAVKSFLAGMMIGIGGLAYVMTGNAWVFPIGLLVVCASSLTLFTGKICYLDQSWWRYMIIYVFNMIGAATMGFMARFVKPGFVDKVSGMCDVKMHESMLQLAILSMLCNLMIFIAVEFWRIWGIKNIMYSFQNERMTLVGMAGIIFATAIFVICGFEHCVANAFYFAFAGVMPSIRFLIVNVVFNAIGGVLAHLAFNKL